MSKIIIGIHGLRNKPPDNVLKKWWKQSICEGLELIGHPHFFYKFELVYWAHFNYPEPLNPDEKDAKNPLFIEDPYHPAKEFLSDRSPKFRDRILSLIGKGFVAIFRKNGIFNFTAVADVMVRHFFRDLYVYYCEAITDDDKAPRLAKEIIREELAQVLRKHRKKDILLIAHSMGSIIAYDVLTFSLPDIKIDTFVTIGSPLGIPAVIEKHVSEEMIALRKKEATPKTPDSVTRNWYNFLDIRDEVPLDRKLHKIYKENSHKVKPKDVYVFNNYEYNDQENPHKSYGYLRTPEMAQVVHEFLNRGKSKVVIWLAERITRLFRKAQIGYSLLGLFQNFKIRKP